MRLKRYDDIPKGYLSSWVYGQCLTLTFMALVKMAASFFGLKGIGFFYSGFGWLLWIPVLGGMLLLTGSDYFHERLAEAPYLLNLSIIFAGMCSFLVVVS